MRLVQISHDFFRSFYEQPDVDFGCIESVKDIYGNLLYSDHKQATQKNIVYKITFIPNYLDVKFKNQTNLKVVSKRTHKGYSIDLKNFKTTNHYLKNHFKDKGKKIKRSLNRLESCFNITYKRFYGDINKKECSELLENLRKMIISRFKERKQTSAQIKNWDSLVNPIHDLINKKRASIFVIYDDKKPIVISVCYHKEGEANSLFSAFSSYDVDYFKFSIGQIKLYKNLEWCFDHNYNTLDMSWGDLDYKRRWSNQIYYFENKKIYNKLLFYSLYAPIKIIHLPLKKILRLLKKKDINLDSKEIETSEEQESFKYNFIPAENFILNNDDWLKIDYKKDEFSFLKKMIYHYIYSNIEHIDNVSFYQNTCDKNKYLFKGKKSNMLCDIKLERSN